MKFDIVIPSLNQVQYLRDTVYSVLTQEGPDIDVSYYVLDGGSTDGSVDLIRSHQSRLAYWRSEGDGVRAADIADGLAMGDGEIVAWIDSDGMYPCGCFQKVAQYFLSHPEVDAVYGDCLLIDKFSRQIGLTNHIPVSWQDLFETLYQIDKGTTFIRRTTYEEAGGVDPYLKEAMDYDFLLRLFYVGQVHYLPEILGLQRVFVILFPQAQGKVWLALSLNGNSIGPLSLSGSRGVVTKQNLAVKCSIFGGVMHRVEFSPSMECHL
jgi:glycosyltransferase involved in cell wall biosynthesis